MKKIGLFYPSETEKTAGVAKQIIDAFGGNEIETVEVEKAVRNSFEAYDNIIAGASTWFDGELPSYWDEVLPEITEADLKGRKVAIFGLGDQTGYPDNFADGIGLLAEAFGRSGAETVGHTSVEGYNFNRSLAVRDGEFLGLVLDMENQPDKTEERITGWVEQLRKEFI